jgi:uncharacterized protein YgiM (DUF1202 family)
MRRIGFIVLLAMLWLSLGSVAAQPLPQVGVNVLVNRDSVNVRVAPALGADIVAYVNAGWTAVANARSPDNQWVRIDFNGEEAWIGLAVLTPFGDISTLPVADPRTIPYGGFESPRSGQSSAGSAINGRLAQSGLRLRAGPSQAYPILANPPRYTVFPLTGRTANNAWLQVNYNGTLGWVTAGFVEIQGGASVIQLPIDGVVADAPPQSQATEDDYIGTLKLMLARLDLAQPSLDSIRGTWTTVSLGQRAACQNFPARPSDMNIANPLLAAFYPTLQPLDTDFNTAMANVRLAIDLWIEACSQPQPPSGVIGEATVIGALNVIQLVDGQIADLRGRLNALIPPPIALGEGQCLFTFGDQFDVLNVIALGQLVQDSLNPRKTATGFCIDANAGDALRVEVLRVTGNLQLLVAVSAFDNPTDFLGVGRATLDQDLLSVGPILISNSGRYLVVISDIGEDRTEPLSGDYALLITNVAGVTVFGPGLGIDPNTGQVVVNPIQATSVPGASPTLSVGAGGCPSTGFSCVELLSCDEAQACLQAGNFSLDPDNNGIACEDSPLFCKG